MVDVGLVLLGRLIRSIAGIYILFNTMTNVVPRGWSVFPFVIIFLCRDLFAKAACARLKLHFIMPRKYCFIIFR